MLREDATPLDTKGTCYFQRKTLGKGQTERGLIGPGKIPTAIHLNRKAIRGIALAREGLAHETKKNCNQHWMEKRVGPKGFSPQRKSQCGKKEVWGWGLYAGNQKKEKRDNPPWVFHGG